MRTAKSLVGVVFTRLTVLERVESPGAPRWRCRCECGGETVVTGGHLRSQHVRSCGCLRRELTSDRFRGKRSATYRHGLMNHPLYRVWAGIQRRCENPRDKSYRYYGARGVAMSEEWRSDPEAFVRWCEANGWTRTNRLVVSRRGDDGDYAPGNCELISKSANSSQAARRSGRSVSIGVRVRRLFRRRQRRKAVL